MTKKIALAFSLAFVFAGCRMGPVEEDDDINTMTTPDAATPPSVADAGTPPPAEPEGEDCRIVGQEASTREGCDACEEAGWRCDEHLEWFCDDAPCVAAPTEDAGTPPPPPVEDAGMMPESDAGTPPPPPPPPAMEDAGTPPPPTDLCAGSPDEICVMECVGAGVRRCNPETGEYGTCTIIVETPCTDAGTPPPPPADAGPSCTPTTEVCDGIDNDCDGETDEASAGTPLSESCYGGPAGTAGTAECRSGVRLCVGGDWSDCLGQVVPRTETCGNGLDEDCNGADLACAPVACSSPLIGTSCSTSGTGACIRTGTYVCSPSGSPVCSVTTPGSPTTEICGNGIDEDCSAGDLACSPPPSGTVPVVFEFRVNDPLWGDDFNQRIRDLVGDFLTCEAWPSGRPPLGPVDADYYRCVLTINPASYKFIGAFLSPKPEHPGQLHTLWHDPSRPAGSRCVPTQGVTWRIYTVATDGTVTNLIPGGSPSAVETSPGFCRHTLP